MKHKKFVKQIMATGRERNTAELMAEICRHHREPYADCLARYKKIMQDDPEYWAIKFLISFTPKNLRGYKIAGGGGNE